MKSLWERSYPDPLPVQHETKPAQETAATPAPMTRRAFLAITAATGGLLATGGFVHSRGDTPVTMREQRMLMGTVIHLAVVAPSARQGRAAIADTFAAMQRLTALFDYRQPQSALSTLNRQGRIDRPAPPFTALFVLAQRISELSGGAFDVTVLPLVNAYRLNAYQQGELDISPYRRLVDYRHLHVEANGIYFDQPDMAVTLDGLAKGRVIDEAVATLRQNGFDRVLVEAGGDLVGRGRRIDDAPWRVGVTHPRSPAGQLLATLEMTDGALATSGDYMNYFAQDFSAHHIIDPRSGHSPAELASVTVMAPTATEADALSTTLMVLGVDQGQALVAQLPSVEALFVTKTLQQIRTPGFPLAAGA